MNKSGYAFNRVKQAKTKAWRKAWRRLANKEILKNYKPDQGAIKLISGFMFN